MKKFKTLLGSLLVTVGLLAGCATDTNPAPNAESSSEPNTAQSSTSDSSNPAQSSSATTDEHGNTTSHNEADILKNLRASNYVYKNGNQPVLIINQDKPNDLDTGDFDHGKIVYSQLDEQNRVGSAKAYLTQNNLGHASSRGSQTFKPTGWNNQPKQVNGKRIWPQNRGHLIAYTLSFNIDEMGNYDPGQKGSEDNPRNLFTQTAFSNQTLMQSNAEDPVRQALENGKKVTYKVTPIFHGNEKMARGVWVEAQSTDKSFNLNRYIWNVQDGLQFDYATGRSQVDHDFHVPMDEGY